MVKTGWSSLRSHGIALAYVALMVGSPEVTSAQQWERPPVFQASVILPPDLQRGPGWTVDQTVQNDGFNNRYVLRTNNGTLDVVSTDLLRIRAQEMAALAQMEQMKRSGVYGEAAKKAATSPVRFAGDLVTSPVDTLQGAARGTGQMFANMGHALFGSPSDQEEGVAKAALGVAAAKRAFAKQFGVDPYSSNQLMQTRLDELAWASAAGGLTVGAAFGAIGGEGSSVLRGTKFAGGAGKLIYDSSPEQLKDINAKRLAGMGVPSDATTAFLAHPKFSPTAKTSIVAALEQMGGVARRGILIDDAVAARTDSEAFQWQRQAEMMAAYNARVAPVARLASLGGHPAMVTKDGTLVLVVPSDYFAWTEALDREVKQSAPAPAMPSGIKRKEIWLSGEASPLARSILKERGWTVKDRQAAILAPG